MAVVGGTVRVRGLRETLRAFRRLEAEIGPEMRTELRAIAEPVALTARSLISPYQGASVRTIGPRVTQTGAAVTQRAKKVTGRRGDFGALQMRRLEEALEEHADEIEPKLEDMLDRITRKEGF